MFAHVPDGASKACFIKTKAPISLHWRPSSAAIFRDKRRRLQRKGVRKMVGWRKSVNDRDNEALWGIPIPELTIQLADLLEHSRGGAGALSSARRLV